MTTSIQKANYTNTEILIDIAYTIYLQFFVKFPLNKKMKSSQPI